MENRGFGLSGPATSGVDCGGGFAGGDLQEGGFCHQNCHRNCPCFLRHYLAVLYPTAPHHAVSGGDGGGGVTIPISLPSLFPFALGIQDKILL